MIILALHAAINIFGHRIIDVLQNVSVWWHVVGAAAVVLILIFVPDNHQSLQFVFTERFNNSGFGDGDRADVLVLRAAAGLPAHPVHDHRLRRLRHVSEETRARRNRGGKGLWQSIFYSAIGGWILLLAFLFAATDVDAINEAAGFSGAIFETALTPVFFKAVIIISTIGQFFCGMSCVTTMSRMTYAFSRGPRGAGLAAAGPRWTATARRSTPSSAATSPAWC